MPLTERDPNFSGRMSRASNMSTGSRGPQKGNAAKPNFFSNAGSAASDPAATLLTNSFHAATQPHPSGAHRRRVCKERRSAPAAN